MIFEEAPQSCGASSWPVDLVTGARLERLQNMGRFALLLVFLFATCLALPQRSRAHKSPTIIASADSGVALFLSDGTAWEIRAENRSKTVSWPKGASIGVYKIADSPYPYRLVLRPGKADSQIVSAMRLQRIK
jgi:hypothetical protein